MPFSFSLFTFALLLLVGPMALGLTPGSIGQDSNEGYEGLADAGQWDELMNRAELQMLEDPEDLAAVAWIGRASYEKSILLMGGDEFSRNLGRALLARSIEFLGRAVEAGSDDLPDSSREWWFAARLQAGHGSQLMVDLEKAWSEQGDAYAAFLRGWMVRDLRFVSEFAAEDAEASGSRSLPWFQRASDAEPARAVFALALSEAFAAVGDRLKATEAWERALKAGADSAGLFGVLLAIYPDREHAALRLDRLRQLAQASDGQPSMTISWAMAHALDELGQIDEAERAFAEVARRGHERTAEFDRAHALLLMRLDRHIEAVALMQPHAAARDWEAYTVLLDIADSLGLARRWEESFAVYEVVRAIEARDERAARNRAITLWRAGRHEEAQQAWREVMLLLPGRADVINDAALSAAGAKDFALSRKLLEESAMLPGSEDARENLAAWHLKNPSGQRAEAVHLLDGLLAEEPERDRALYLRFLAGRLPDPGAR